MAWFELRTSQECLMSSEATCRDGKQEKLEKKNGAGHLVGGSIDNLEY